MQHLESWPKRLLRRLRREKEWTILLVTDADTEYVFDRHMITADGLEQVHWCSIGLHMLLGPTIHTIPRIWHASPYGMHAATAEALNAQVGSTDPVHDWSTGAGLSYPWEAVHGNFIRLVLELEAQAPVDPVVLVLLYDYGACLLRAAGIDVHHGRAMRSGRPYPLVITSRGRVKLSPLSDLTVTAPELTRWPRTH